MRALIFAAFIAASPAVIAQDPFLTGDALLEAIQRDCEEGCITLNREEAHNLTRNVANLVAEREAEAFRRGTLSCRNAI